jgi:DNA-directed RNA polymerase subunit L
MAKEKQKPLYEFDFRVFEAGKESGIIQVKVEADSEAEALKEAVKKIREKHQKFEYTGNFKIIKEGITQ